MLAIFDTIRIFLGKVKRPDAKPTVTEAPTEPRLNWIYQPPAKGMSYDQWRASMAEMPDCDEARQIFQKHQ